jgi:hypothetical protein
LREVEALAIADGIAKETRDAVEVTAHESVAGLDVARSPAIE